MSSAHLQISVWRTLLEIPPAKVVSYAQVASAVGNPVALMIPYQRVIQQNGKLGGYHWGETRKEAARYE